MEQWRTVTPHAEEWASAPSSREAIGTAGTSFVREVTPHVPAMLRAAAALVGLADAEDATQEAVVRAWQAAPTLHEMSSLGFWLLRITVNVCKDWRRGRFGTRHRLTEPLAEDADVWTPAAIGADPGTSDHTGALDMRLAVNALEPHLRLVVALRYYAGMDATVIGDTLGIPAATVRTRLRRALALLREELSAHTHDATANQSEGGR
jgi:RNA polymerase sigma factor CnrH